ncbi:MAG: hypothetical protein AAGN82_11390 [Myxococcota bacterium]
MPRDLRSLREPRHTTPAPRSRGGAKAVLGLGLLAAAWAPSVAAQTPSSKPADAPAVAPSAADKETARTLFYEGQEALEAKAYERALRSFRAADGIMSVPSTRLEVGRALMLQGRLVEAVERFTSVALIPVPAGENAVQRQAREEARRLVDEVRARIAVLDIEVSGVAPKATVRLTVDGDAVPAEAFGFPRRVDPGTHVVVAEADGYRSQRQRVTVAPAEKKRVVLRLTPAPGGGASPPRDASPSPTNDGFVLPAWGWVGFGVGAVGAIVGGVTGGLTLGRVDDLRDACDADNVCPPEQQSEIDATTTVAHVATASFAVAAAGVAVGLAAVFVGLGATDDEDVGARGVVTPWFGLSSVGVTGRF